MSLKNLVERELISCNPDTSVQEVARMMDDKDVGAIVVLDGGKPIGIVTDRDLVVRCIVEGKECKDTRVRDVMTDDVETVSIDQGIFDVVRIMKESQIRRLPVVDDKGKCVGLLSFGDIFALLGREIGDLAAPATPETPKLVDKAA